MLFLRAFLLLLAVFLGSATVTVAQRPEQGVNPRAEFWRGVREGTQGNVTIPDKQAGQLIQSEGEVWRSFRNGPMSTWGVWGILGTIGVLALFFAIRGRVRLQGQPSGRLIERFSGLERMGHWLTASSFVLLALTGLNMLYGRYALLPLIGAEAFSILTLWGKYIHDYVAFAFMAGLILTFLLWVRHNIPAWRDLVWLAKGGGMVVKGVHVHATKFNAGQKVIFWVVMLGGLSVSLSGIALLFPYQTALFSKTFGVLNLFGFGLPTDLTALQEQQLNQVWHAIVGLVLMAVIIAHIYIGTLGMQGAFQAMGSGKVDETWAKEHHDLWVQDIEERARRREPADGQQPAPAE